MINIKVTRSFTFLRCFSHKVFIDGVKALCVSVICISANAQDLPAITDFNPSIQESTDTAGFIHPGVGLTKPILENVRAQVIAQQEPWYSYYKDMLATSAASRTAISSNASSANPTTPLSLAFNSQSFNSRFIADGLKVYTQALLFYITGDDVYRTNAMNILRVWGQMDPAQYAYFSDAHIHTGIPMNRMLAGAEILRYTNSQNSASAWTEADTQALTNNLIIPATETFMHRNNEFMNQHGYPLMGAMAGYIFTGNKDRYTEAVEWMTVNKTALNQGFNGSIKRLFRLVDRNAKTGELLATPVVQHVEMGRDQAHGAGDLNNATIIAHMFYAQNSKVDPVSGELSTAPNAVGMYEFLNDRVLHAADFFWRYMAGNPTDWVPTEFSIFADGQVGGLYNFISSQYRGRMLTTNFWDLYYYYTYTKGVDLSVVAPYFYKGFQSRVPGRFYYARGLANAWENVDGGGDFWLYIPAEVANEGAASLPKPQLNASLIEPEERYTAFDSNSQTLSEAGTDFVRLMATPEGAKICLFNFSYGGRPSVLPYGIKVRTNGVATLALSTGLEAQPYQKIELPNTNNQWRYVVYDAGTGAIPSGIGGSYSLNYVFIEGDGTQVDIDNFNVNAGTELSAPVFIEGVGNQVIYTYVGAAINKNFAATDPNPADVISYKLDQAPAGAGFNEQTGAFTWIPQSAGHYSFVVSANDALTSTTKKIDVYVEQDRNAALSSINAGFDGNAIYSTDSLENYEQAYAAATTGLNNASEAEFAALLQALFVAVSELQLVTPLLGDGSLNFASTVASTTFGGVYSLVDADPDTFTGFLSGANLYHILDFGIDHKVSATAFGVQARMNFADRGAGITVFASNDSQNWTRITPDESPFQDDLAILPVDAAYQNSKYRYFKLQMVNPHPDALRNQVLNLMELGEVRIWGERFETNNKIEAINVAPEQVGTRGIVFTGSELTLSLVAKEAIENLVFNVQGVNAVVSTTDGIHWTASVTLPVNANAGALSYYLSYVISATGQSNDAFIKSNLYVTNGTNIIDGISSLADLIDPSTSFGRPSAAVTAQQVGNLFDNNADTISDFRLGGNGAGGYITFDFKFGGSVALTGVDILARQDGYYTRINGTRIQASQDNQNWITISSSAISTNEWQALTITDPQHYRYIRIYNSNSWFGNMAEVKFHGSHRGPVDLISTVGLSSTSADATGLIHIGDEVSISIGAVGLIADMDVSIQGVPASVSQINDNAWIATATMSADVNQGYVGFTINYTSTTGATGTPESSTTDGSRLYLINGDDLLLNIAEIADLIDPSTTFGRPNAAVTLSNVNALFDGNAGTVSDFRIGTNGSGGYITFDFKEGNSVWLTGVNMLARQDNYYTRIESAVVQGSNDNINWTTITSPALATRDWQNLSVTTQSGYRYLRLYNWRNWFGNMAEVRLHVDNKPPVTQANIPTGWVNSDVLLEFNAIDDASGVDATYFALGDAQSQSATSVVVSTEGSNDLMFWSADKAGNVENINFSQVKLDKTLPQYLIELNGEPFVAGESIQDNQTLSLTISDTLSGLELQQVSLDGQIIAPSVNTTSYRIYLPGKIGSHQLHITAKDLAGNQLNEQLTFRVETNLESLISLFIEGVNSGDITGKLADKLSRILRQIQHIVSQSEIAHGMNSDRIILQLLTNMSHELSRNSNVIDANTLEILKNDVEALIRLYRERVEGL